MSEEPEDNFRFDCPFCEKEIDMNLNKIIRKPNIDYNKKAFIISPIGDYDSPKRRQADEILNFVVKPALDDLRIKAIRADEIHYPGRITDQMFDAIFDHDLCVAIITKEPNPNVFYEIAIAQCANKPLVILIPKGTKPPFDIHNIRCVEYDLSIEAFLKRSYIKKIKKLISAFESGNYKPDFVNERFKDYVRDNLAKKMIEKGKKDCKLYEKARMYNNEDWIRFLKDTQKKFYIMGRNLGAWKRISGFSNMLLEKAAQGVDIRILILHEENPILREKINPDIPETSLEELKNAIINNYNYYSDIAHESENIKARQIRKGYLTTTLAINDDFSLYLPHFYSERPGFSPLWRCRRDSELYKLMKREFLDLWKKSALNNSP